MNRFILIALLSVSAASACTSKMPATYNTQTKQLYVLTDAVNSIGALQTAAENAVPANILPLATARNIVTFCVAANQTISQTPNGWYSVVSAAWVNVKNQLSADELNKFSGPIAAFEIILNSFGGSN